jgi:hypothetical protein
MGVSRATISVLAWIIKNKQKFDVLPTQNQNNELQIKISLILLFQIGKRLHRGSRHKPDEQKAMMPLL